MINMVDELNNLVMELILICQRTQYEYKQTKNSESIELINNIY